jgi:hypothetical protein
VFEFGRGGLNQIHKKTISVGSGEMTSEFGALLYRKIITAFVIELKLRICDELHVVFIPLGCSTASLTL